MAPKQTANSSGCIIDALDSITSLLLEGHFDIGEVMGQAVEQVIY